MPSPRSPLVAVAELQAHLADPGWCIVDCRHDLADPGVGPRLYAAGHVPGAVFAHLDHDLSGPKNGRNGRHPLPDPDLLAARFARWGIGNGTRIVGYDANGGSFAVRLWWLARWLGHDDVAVLDGGWPAWVAAGLPQTAEVPARPAATFVRRAPTVPQVDADEVLRTRGDVGRVLVDARAPERYSGAQETVDPVGGHIPGALNRFWQRNLAPDGRFKPAADLRREFEALLDGQPASAFIAQCGSGVTGCHHLLAMQVAGLDGGALYPGSWSEWIADPARPRATGDQPG